MASEPLSVMLYGLRIQTTVLRRNKIIKLSAFIIKNGSRIFSEFNKCFSRSEVQNSVKIYITVFNCDDIQ